MSLLVLPTGIAWSIADSRRINVFEYANDQIEARLFLETFWTTDAAPLKVCTSLSTSDGVLEQKDFLEPNRNERSTR
jgi:hypothetical protein